LSSYLPLAYLIQDEFGFSLLPDFWDGVARNVRVDHHSGVECCGGGRRPRLPCLTASHPELVEEGRGHDFSSAAYKTNLTRRLGHPKMKRAGSKTDPPYNVLFY